MKEDAFSTKTYKLEPRRTIITRNPTLKRNHLSNPIHLPVKILMLRDIKRVNINKVLGPLDHIDSLLEAFRLCSPSSNNSIALNHIVTALLTKVHSLNPTSHLHQLHGFPGGANGFQVSKSFANPVNDTSLFFERLDVRATGDEDGVEHG